MSFVIITIPLYSLGLFAVGLMHTVVPSKIMTEPYEGHRCLFADFRNERNVNARDARDETWLENFLVRRRRGNCKLPSWCEERLAERLKSFFRLWVFVYPT